MNLGWSDNPCINGHVFMWAGASTESVPEGMPCACGHTYAHYVNCKCCGAKQLVALPYEEPK
jgi:hypothetical protein